MCKILYWSLLYILHQNKNNASHKVELCVKSVCKNLEAMFQGDLSELLKTTEQKTSGKTHNTPVIDTLLSFIECVVHLLQNCLIFLT